MAHAAGLELLGYATQANFLVNCGITEALGRSDAADMAHDAPLAAIANRSLSPSEMGELFKVLARRRRMERPLVGFARGNRSHTL